MTLELVQYWKYTCDFCKAEELIDGLDENKILPDNWVRIDREVGPPTHYCSLCVKVGEETK